MLLEMHSLHSSPYQFRLGWRTLGLQEMDYPLGPPMPQHALALLPWMSTDFDSTILTSQKLSTPGDGLCSAFAPLALQSCNNELCVCTA